MNEITNPQSRVLSKETKEKSEIAKKFIEQKYQKNFQEEKKKKEYYDKLISQMNKMSLTEQDLKVIINDLNVKYLKQKRQKESILDYQSLAIIGRGAFGEVRLCRHKTGEIVAVKKMSKKEMNEKKQLNHIRAERDLLVSSDAHWIVELKCSFTDINNLYLVMEYVPGGDLMNLLIEKNVFDEDLARFYIAESILAVESVHKLNYIHRDLKPDNILIGKDGHIKLTDFGLCKPYQLHVKNFEDQPHMIQQNQKNLSKREKVYSMVGTVDYIAPEVFTNDGYTETVDWWSLGTILFEMLMGYPPFYGENPTATCRKVMNFEKYFEIPSEIQVSPEAIDILKRLITRPENRLGINGVEEIKRHPFFNKIDWKNLRKQKALYIPKLSSDTDTSNFDKFDETTKWHEEYIKGKNNHRRRKRDYFWIGYSYKKPYNYEVGKDLKEILDNLKKKKSIQKKRMFSEERIAAFKKKSVSKNFIKKKKDIDFKKKYGNFFVKKKNEQQEVIEMNKEKHGYYFENKDKSYQTSDKKNILKKYKKKDKKKGDGKDKNSKKSGIKTRTSGLRHWKQQANPLLDSQEYRAKPRKISSRNPKQGTKKNIGIFSQQNGIGNPYSFAIKKPSQAKKELASLKLNKKYAKSRLESSNKQKYQLIIYIFILIFFYLINLQFTKYKLFYFIDLKKSFNFISTYRTFSFDIVQIIFIFMIIFLSTIKTQTNMSTWQNTNCCCICYTNITL